MNYQIIKDIVTVVLRNRRDKQIDEHGQYLDDHLIEPISEEIHRLLVSYRTKISSEKMFKLIELVLIRWESSLNSTPAMVQEYGM